MAKKSDSPQVNLMNMMFRRSTILARQLSPKQIEIADQMVEAGKLVKSKSPGGFVRYSLPAFADYYPTANTQ
jgi:hypothetical protein